MNIFILGNGFDLCHDLPTSYVSFLHTVNFLKDNYNEKMDTVGKVFGNEFLLTNDRLISKSYMKYNVIYNKTSLNKDKMSFLVKKAKNNMWFLYLTECLNKDVGWIDFEKEIARVINALNTFVKSVKKVDAAVRFTNKEYDVSHMIKFFNFFVDNYIQHSAFMDAMPSNRIKKDYIKEEPFGSKHFEIDKNKIATTLYESLIELSEMLKIYLECFVETPLDELKYVYIWKRSAFTSNEIVVTFNYTNTYEKVYFGKNVCHIHGSLDTRIVLGINPDLFDEIEQIDTTFISFKKYYQRIIYRTDIEYRNLINDINSRNVPVNTLSVVGHSLDATDQDIIKELFEISKKIIIYFHSPEAQEQHIKNLITIYGKRDFDNLRTEKNLEFTHIDELN